MSSAADPRYQLFSRIHSAPGRLNQHIRPGRIPRRPSNPRRHLPGPSGLRNVETMPTSMPTPIDTLMHTHVTPPITTHMPAPITTPIPASLTAPMSITNPDPELADGLQSISHRRRNAFIPGFRSRPPFKIWLHNNWLDIFTQLLCVLTAFMLYTFAPPLMPRYFPLYAGIEHSAFGIRYGKPYMAEYITTPVSAIVSYVAPLLVMGAIGLWWIRDFADGNAAVSFKSRPFML